MLRPTTRLTPQKIQPMALRGWRAATMAPMIEKGSRVTTEIAPSNNCSPSYENPVPTESAATDNKLPHRWNTKGSAASDHANHVIARRLIRPVLSCLGSHRHGGATTTRRVLVASFL